MALNDRCVLRAEHEIWLRMCHRCTETFDTLQFQNDKIPLDIEQVESLIEHVETEGVTQ